ncbi:unnamed protein product [Rotaria magnacalcarata]|nr:unnamed protein product [Rotaria magnacalcarata]CAF2182447.1 unnamed protein product [Rotaria magnacalcarata]
MIREKKIIFTSAVFLSINVSSWIVSFISFIIYFANKSSCINFFSVVAFYAWMFTSKHLAKPVRKTWKNQPASSLGKAVLKD